MIDGTAIEKIANLAKEVVISQVVDGAPILLRKEGYTPVDLTPYLNHPLRVQANPVHLTPESFSDYVNRFKTQNTVIQGSLGQNQVTGFIDYHEPQGDAAWCGHAPSLKLTKTKEFSKVLALNDKPQSQTEFAEFLEDIAHCVFEPDSAAIKESVLAFEETRNVSFQSKVDRHNGTMKFSYQDEKATVKSVKLPETIGIVMPIFEGGNPVTFAASLRYTCREGDLKLRIVIQQVDKAMREAFNAVVEDIENRTNIKPYVLV